MIQPNDTLAYFYAGFVANGLEDYDKAIASFQKYIDLGGKSSDAYLSHYQYQQRSKSRIKKKRCA